MDALELRNPVSALSHLFGCVAGMYLTLLFWRLTQGDPLRRYSTLCYGLSMVVLYAASTAYHSVTGNESIIHFFRKLDHSAIFILIAGTYTPFFAMLLSGSTRVRILVTIWAIAVVGIIAKWAIPLGPHNLSVAAFLAMGAVGLIPIPQMSRAVGLKPLVIGMMGGVCYITGGICDAIDWPVLYAPIFCAHEFMHIMDLLGTSFHVYFLIRYVLPYRPQ